MTSRRTVLRFGLASIATAAALPGLTSCGKPAASTNTAQINGGAVLPTYLPSTAAAPDLPAEPAGVQEVFFRYPEPPIQQFDSPIGSGQALSWFGATYTPPATPRTRNPFWQEVERAVGTELNLNFVPAADYSSKLATILASDDAPDVVQIATPPPQLPQLMKAKFANLSPFLSGDAVKDYPNLANLPTASWQATIFNGGVYAVPVPRAAVGAIFLKRDDILQRFGMSGDVQSFEEFREQAKTVTRPKDNLWAFPAPAGPLIIVQQMMGVANGWTETGGKFTSAIEQPETKEAIARVTEMLKDDLFHPDALVPNGEQKKQLFGSGFVAFHYDNYSAWPVFYTQYEASEPGLDIGGMIPPAFETGMTPKLWSGSGYFSYSAISKASDDRIREILRILNWFAAPFGTQEYLLRKYGIEGKQFDMKDGAPILRADASADISVPFQYLTDSPPVIFEPGRNVVAKKEHAYQVRALPMAVTSAAQGMFSDTQGTKGARLQLLITEAQNNIFAGRQPLSSWDDAVSQWRKEGGDAVRTEYEQQLTAR